MDFGAEAIHRQFLGHYLAAEAVTIAKMAAAMLVSQDAAVAARYSPQPELKWRAHFEGWVTDLAAAANTGAPGVFAARMDWCLVAFAARGAPVSDLGSALGALKQAVIRHVPVEDVRWLTAVFEVAEARLSVPAADPAGEPLSRLSKLFLLAVLEGERLRASRLVREAVAGGVVAPERVAEEVLVPVMREVGRLWHLGELSVAEEHFATATVDAVLSQVMTMVTPKARNGLTLIAASVEGNTHDLGVKILADAFELEGWRTVCLGGSVPVEDLSRAVIDFEADLVGLSAMVAHQLPVLGDAVTAVRGVRPVKVIVGGAALGLVPEASRRFGADGWAETPGQAVELAAKMFGLAPSGRDSR